MWWSRFGVYVAMRYMDFFLPFDRNLGDRASYFMIRRPGVDAQS